MLKRKPSIAFISGILTLLVAVPILYWLWRNYEFNNIFEYFKYLPERHMSILLPLPVIVISVLALIIGKIFYQSTVSFSLARELTDKDNPAIGLYLAGFLLGLGLALTGCVTGLQDDALAAFFSLFMGIIIFIPLLRLSALIHDKVLLYKFSVIKEIRDDRNAGTGAVCCGAFIGTGLILKSSFLGDSPDFKCFFLSILGAYLLGQIIFLIGGFVFQKAVGYDFHYEIGARGNISAGIILGSFLASLGLVISTATTDLSTTATFWVESTYQRQLNKGDMTKLTQKFADHDITLSSHISVKSVSANKEWLITDENDQTKYNVTKEGNSLKICGNKTEIMLLYHFGFAAAIGLLGILVLLGMGIIAAKLVFPRVSLDDEVRQKNPAVALVIASVYLTVAFIINLMLSNS